MDTTLLIVAVLVVAALILFLVLRKKPAAPSIQPPETHAAATPAPVAPVAPAADPAFQTPGATAIENVASQFLGVDTTPPVGDGAGDDLTVLKGLGPKAAAQLNALGVTRYSQLAALEGDSLTALDAQMGTFKGRATRDRWVEQAAHLASGDTAGFEAKFGKLG